MAAADVTDHGAGACSAVAGDRVVVRVPAMADLLLVDPVADADPKATADREAAAARDRKATAARDREREASADRARQRVLLTDAAAAAA
ncbi:hypothetical protein E2562_016403 [Oryza meyeriana var. granulata]|uniref:Uncharacterized protein n=1 Tax=Oryza meyeriana var. granulata TaxID=110450 RepID=A0A6G1EX03_9ORYZ|nr:hypothetical protein E2562_016403 [Oryza meyeriana var. granulata]